MAEQRMKVRDKKVQKMTKDGLVEENLTDKSSVRVSNRASDVQMGGKQGEKEVSLVDKSSRQSERSGKNIRPSVQKSRDAPELIRAEKQSEDLGQSRKQQNRKRIRAEVGKESRLAEKSEAGQSGRLKEKRADLSENRGDSRRNQTGGSKKPKQKQRLKFAYEETGASVKNDKDMEKLNQMDTDGVNFRHQKQKEKAKKFSYEEAKKKKEAKQHSKKAQVYQANDGEAPGKKKSRLKFGEGESVKTEKTSVVKKAGSAASAALHREISKNEDDNAAVEGAHKLEESGEGVYRLEQRSARRRKQRAFRKRSRLERQEEKQTQAAARQEQKKLKKQIQKQQIKRDYAKAKRSEQTVGTATKGTIDYIKKIGGKVTNFFKENRKVYISVAVLIGLMFLIITNVTSCSAVFLQNVITYTGTSYLSSDQAIREAELYYTQLEANLQEWINNMESEEPGHEEYRYNIGPIEHDPFILISYLSAKYEEFTFEQVKPELDALFAEQYHLTTEAVNETVTETATVRVEILQLSEFYEITARSGDDTIRRIIMIPTSGFPDDRESAAVNSVVKDRASFVEYIAFVLGDDYVASMLEGKQMGESGFFANSSDAMPALYEKMLKTSVEGPERIKDIGYVLKMVTDKDIIPDEFRELYETFCNTLKIRR